MKSPGTHYYAQVWLLLLSVLVFGSYVAWDLRIFDLVLSLDKSYMASLTMALVILATAHCGWHVFHCSRRIELAQHWLNNDFNAKDSPDNYVQLFLDELELNIESANVSADANSVSADDSIVEIHADKLRGHVDLGWFFVDLAVRLGLLGTIIGFILIFSSLTDLNISGGDELKNLLIAMSGGMGTALLTTLTGLIGASVLSFQYLILGREAESLVGLLLRVKNQYTSSNRRSTYNQSAYKQSPSNQSPSEQFPSEQSNGTQIQ